MLEEGHAYFNTAAFVLTIRRVAKAALARVRIDADHLF